MEIEIYNNIGLWLLIGVGLIMFAVVVFLQKTFLANSFYVCISENKIQVASFVNPNRKVVVSGDFSSGPNQIIADSEALHDLISIAGKQCVLKPAFWGVNRVVATSRRPLNSEDVIIYKQIIDRISDHAGYVNGYVSFEQAKSLLDGIR